MIPEWQQSIKHHRRAQQPKYLWPTLVTTLHLVKYCTCIGGPTYITLNSGVNSSSKLFWTQLNAFLLVQIITNMEVVFILFGQNESILWVNKTHRQINIQVTTSSKKTKLAFAWRVYTVFSAAPLLTVVPWCSAARWSWQTQVGRNGLRKWNKNINL